MRYLAVDPGVNIGWAYMEDGKPFSVGTEKWESPFFDWLEEQGPDLWVVEAYVIRPPGSQGGYMHQWNKGEALQVVGAIKFHARRRGTPVVEQQAADKTLGSRITGLVPAKGASNRHQLDAVNHGVIFWHRERNRDRQNTSSSQASH